jgi:hypothetical protein
MNRFKIQDLGFRNGMLIIILTSYFLLPTSTPVLAQEPTEYQLLAPIPIEESGCIGSAGEACKTNASQYIKGIFILMIGIAGGLAVLMIIFGGIKYMSTDAFGGKSEAKATIEHAIWGLLLAMSAWLILNTVNPKLVNFDLKIPVQSIPTNTNPGSGSASPGSLGLTQQQASSAFRSAGVGIDGGINLAGIKQGTVDEVIRLKITCSSCVITVTSATGGVHAPGTISHASGYKVDLRLNNNLTNYITRNYTQLPDRINPPAKMYRAPSGAIYALESDHWDISVPGS